MVVMCAVLGFQQVALKGVADDMAPILQLAVRSGIAAVLVAVLIKIQRHSFSLSDGTLWPGLGLGVLFTLEYGFLGEGLLHTSASRIVIFLYTAPVFSALFLHFLRPEERLRATQWCGIGLAFAGIAVAFLARDGLQSDVLNSASVWGDFLGLLAGLAWGLSTVLVRSSALSEAAASKTLLYQLVVATVLLMLLAIAFNQAAFTVTPVLVANLLFQGIVVSFLVFLSWFALLKNYVASQLGVLLFMSPVFGVAFGVILLGEPLQPAFIVGSLLVIVGILFVTADQMLFRRKSQ